MEPAIIRFYDITEEERELKITNRDDQPNTFTVTSVKPSRIFTGYETIPQDWIIPAEREFILGPQESKTINIKVTIPKSEKPSHLRYHGIVEVRRNKRTVSDFFVLATRTYIFIESEDGE